MEPSADQTSPATPAVLNYAEAAARLGVTETWLRNKVRRKAVPHIKYGRYVKFTEDDLAEIIATGRRTVVEPAAKSAAPTTRNARRRSS